ncbi:phosphotransferase [Clostridium botulinum]|uniref:phosphotransferase n=1 Tax=Clostridium botulinum TaxID=1491 RepID=UPI001C9ACE56|nr:phosphotransferase [Clostridium botulinum]MBY6898523.1 phosphotransferase [Clostridium botulinum]MBY6912849.1 phosphotransferase [Clostridium botulinum]
MLKDMLIKEIREYVYHKNLFKIINLSKSFNVRFLAQGEYNINFILEDEINKYVFRVNTGSQLSLENQIEYEYSVFKRLENSKVTPKVYYVDGSREYIKYGVLIMEFLDGRPLNYEKDLNKAAKIFGKIHSIELNKEDFSSFIIENNIFSDRIKEANNLLKDFWDSSLIKEDIKKFFYKFINWATENSYKEKYFIDDPIQVINNTEVNSHNFIIGSKNFYLIDWEKPVISDPCQDLTQFLAPTTTLWKANYILKDCEINEFFYNYEIIFKGKNIRERVDMYTPYLYLRALSWCAHAYLEYQNPDRDIKNMDTYEKIKEYLELDFMSNLLSRWF